MAFDLASAAPIGVSPDEPPKKGFDLKSAKPVDGSTKPPPKDEPHWFKDIVGAAVEPIISMGTGALGAVAGGVAGAGQAVERGLGFNKEAGEPGDVARRVAGKLTYEPRTTGGKNAMKVIGAIPEKIGEFSDEAGGKTTEFLHKKVGLPHEVAAGVGAVGNAAMQFLPQLAGSRGAGAAAERAPRVVPDIMPKPTEAVTALTDRGVKLTPGQLLGGGWDRAEQMLAKWPIVGAPIRGARARAFEQFDEAAMNDVLAPIKQKLPANVPPGHPAIEYVRTKLGARYDDILEKSKGSLDGPGKPVGPQLSAPGATGVPPAAGKTLRQELTSLKQMMDGSRLPKKFKDEFSRILDGEVFSRFEKSGLASGQTIKDIEHNLRVLEEKKAKSDNYDVMKVGLAIKETRAALKRMTARENPGLADELRATDEAYSKFKVTQRASANAGKNGLFTPDQFQRAVKAGDRTKDKRAFAEGKANMQDLAKAAKEVLGDTIPDSGTPAQLLLAAALSGKGTGLLGIPGGVAGAGALAIPYSPLGVRAMQRGITGPPISGVPAARALPFGAGAYPNQVTPPPQ